MHAHELTSASFDLHGVSLQARSEEPLVLDAIRSRLRHFEAEPVRDPELVFDIGPGTAWPSLERSGARPVYDTPLGEVLYAEADDVLLIDCGAVTVRADLAAGLVRARYSQPEPEQIALVTHPLLTLPLLELMKRRGRYPLHAAAVARRGRAVLIAAASGSGKSTLSVALARAGFDFLSDDMVFLTDGPVGPRVMAFPDELDLTDGTAARFPELAHLVGRPTWGGRPKHQIRGEEIGFRTVDGADPALVVLPVLTHLPPTTAVPSAPGSVLLELAPNVLLTQPAGSQAHLAALGGLAESVPCWTLQLGTDLDRAVDVVSELLG